MIIGINAMSTIDAMRQDFTGCIRRLRDGGCSFVEAVTDWGASPEKQAFFLEISGPSGWELENTPGRIREMQQIGMRVEGAFVHEDLLEEQAEALGAFCRENGLSYLVISFMEYGDLDDIYQKVGLIRRISKVFGRFGVRLLMHNHDHDTVIIRDRDGQEKQILQIFLEQCSAEDFLLETDTGWLEYSGIDAVSYVREHLPRIAVLHLKDLKKGYENLPREEMFVPCGQGVVNFPEIIRVARKKPDLLYVLDQDFSQGDIIEDHIASIRYLNGL